MEMKMNGWDTLAMTLLLIGGLNWGLIGFFGFDAVGFFFGTGTLLGRAIFAVVGLAALYSIFAWAYRYSMAPGRRARLAS